MRSGFLLEKVQHNKFMVSQPVVAVKLQFHFIPEQGLNMALDSGSTMKIIGIILMMIGAGLVLWGYQLSGSVSSQVTQAVTGSDTDKVMTFYITGAASFVVGIYLFVKN